MALAPFEDSNQPRHQPAQRFCWTQAKGLSYLHANSKEPDQTGWMSRLICLCWECHFVGFVSSLLIFLCFLNRIYIKKVRKFPEYGVDINMDKRSLKNAMDKAFHELKSVKLDSIGQER